MRTSHYTRIAALLLLICSVASSRAATEITGYIWVTNTPAGLTTNITIDIGAADTRNWTNAASGAPSTSIQITNSAAASATNLYQHLTAYPVYSAGASSPQLLVAISQTNAAMVTVTAPLNTNLTVTFGGLWAFVTYVTNTYSDSAAILNRTNAMSSASRTNAENAIVNLLAANRSTNAVPTNSSFLRHYTDTNTPQTVANKTLINPVATGGRWTGATNMTGTNVAFTNVILRLVTVTGADLTGIITALSNGTIYASVLDGVRPTNVFGLAGAVHQIIGGTWSNGTLTSATLLTPSLSNATLFGSGTTITGAAINLVGSGANNFVSLTATSTTAAVGPIFYMARENGIATAVDSGDVLGIIGFTGYGTTAQKVGARIRAIPMETFTDSTAGTILLIETTPSGATTPVGRLHVSESGFVTVSNVLYAQSITNATMRGTNIVNGQVVYTPTANTALGNGNNAAVGLEGVHVRLSGPTAGYTNVGFSAANKMDGKMHFVQADNPGLSFAILNDSSLDAGDTNRVLTGTGTTLHTTNNPAQFIISYDDAVDRWRVWSFR